MENNDKNVSLDDMMEGKAPRSSEDPIDLTKGRVTAKRDDSVDALAYSAEAVENMEAETGTKKVVVTPVTTAAPLNAENLAPVSAFDILPKREDTKTSVEADIFADLDKAVDRECDSITKRVEELTDTQRQEFEDAEAAAADAAQAKEDAENVRGVFIPTDDDEDDDLGLYTDDEDDVAPTKVNAITAMTDDEVEAESDSPAVVEKAAPVKVADIVEEKPEPIIARVTKTSESTSILDGVDNESLFEDDDSDEADADVSSRDEENLENLKREVREKISPTTRKLDLTKFEISKKSINAQKAMKLAAQTKQAVADWALLSAGRPISMTGLSGPEILKLNPENSSRNRLNTFRDMYRVIYDHVYDANKPEFETWLKQTRFVDLQHIYFAIYMATFNGSNFLNFQCPHCNKVFIKDVKFEDMVKYADDKTRETVKNILKMDTNTHDNDTYPVDLVQISDNYAFGLRTPSIWNVIIETASLSDKFLEKHADLIDLVSYIDGIYIIDTDTNQLHPIDTKPDRNDQAKTSARRIKAFYDIISQLSSEEYYALRAQITEYDEGASKMSYQIPACSCPDCATEIPVTEDMSPDNLLFTRHQLAAIGNM